MKPVATPLRSESATPPVLAAIRPLAVRRPGWSWWAEPLAPGLVEVSWRAPGAPVGAVRVREDAGPASISADIAHAVRRYEAVYVPDDEEAA